MQINVPTFPGNSALAHPMELRMPVERLPFTVRIATTEEELRKAVHIRHLAYLRHVPDFAERLREPEQMDLVPGTLVLLAESKLDGSALGTMRIQTNEFEPLRMEQSVTFPDWLQGQHLVEATRLGVSDGHAGRVVKAALLKACFTYCKRSSVDWMVITARKPLDRQYDALMFEDVFASGEYIPMLHVGNIPHRVMAINVHTAESRWEIAGHPLYNFMCQTRHPDIDAGIDNVVCGNAIPYSTGVRSRNRMNLAA